MSTSDVIADETPGQRAARLRREKLKNKAAGEERLAKIKKLNGGEAPPQDVLGGAAAQHEEATDPDEVDISTHRYGGSGPRDLNASVEADNPMFQAMMQMQQEQTRQQAGSKAVPSPQRGPPGQAEDPMARMLQQMMGMSGGDPNDPNSVHNTEDPVQMLSALLNGAKNSQPASQPRSSSSMSTYIWRLTHAVFAIIIAGYIAATNTFDGSFITRTQSTFMDGAQDGLGSRLFLIFVTAELGLQSARFFMEGGRLQGGGMLATIANFAPEPYGSYVSIAGRWISMLGSIVSDFMVIVFVLGVMAWWNGSSSVS